MTVVSDLFSQAGMTMECRTDPGLQQITDSYAVQLFEYLKGPVILCIGMTFLIMMIPAILRFLGYLDSLRSGETVHSYAPTKYSFCNFLLGAVNSPSGYTKDSLLYLSDEELERKHNYIQYYFPLRRRSFYALEAPVAHDEDYLEVIRNEKAMETVRASFHRMMDFWKRNYQNYGDLDHNYLRMSRVATVLMELGMDKELEEMKDLMKLILEKGVCEKTQKIWRETFGVK